jgi:hypothetical protein
MGMCEAGPRIEQVVRAAMHCEHDERAQSQGCEDERQAPPPALGGGDIRRMRRDRDVSGDTAVGRAGTRISIPFQNGSP